MVPYWFCTVFTVISACVCLGYSAAAVSASRASDRLDAHYAFGRSLALAAVAAVTLFPSGATPDHRRGRGHLPWQVEIIDALTFPGDTRS